MKYSRGRLDNSTAGGQAELDAPGEYYIGRAGRGAAARADLGMLFFHPPSSGWQ